MTQRVEIVAGYPEGPTGCMVIRFPQGAMQAIDRRGGLIGLMGDYETIDALCLAGGSLVGLEAGAGVAAEVWAAGGFSTEDLPTVTTACIYDFFARDNAIYPDKALGRAACQALEAGIFPLGWQGAGIAAGVGQGCAFREVDEVCVAVFTMVNALGDIFDRTEHMVTPDPNKEPDASSVPEDSGPAQHTTLTVVVTNQKLTPRALTQLGRQVHASMGRAIYPFHTTRDGDVLFALTTSAVESSGMELTELGMVASDLAWDAVLSSVDA